MPAGLKHWRLQLRAAARGLAPAELLRGGLACAVPAMAAAVLQQPLWCWAAIAAFWACLADLAEAPPSRRLAAGLRFALAGALASGAGAALQPWPVAAVLLAVGLSFGAALLQGLQPRLGLRALLVATAAAVSAVLPVQDAAQAAGYALHFLAGGLWAALCHCGGRRSDRKPALWRAAAAYFEAAAGFTLALADAGIAPAGGRALLRRRLDALHAALAQVGPQAPAGSPGRVGETLLAALAGLETLLGAAPAAPQRPLTRARLRPALAALAARLRACARTPQALPAAVGLPPPPADEDLATNEQARLAACLAVVETLHRLLDRPLGAAAASAAAPRPEPAPTPAPAPAALWRDAIGELRGRSRWARYAVRMAVSTGAAVGLAHALRLQQGNWLVITAIFVMQPGFAQTLRTSALRLSGTALGAGLALALECLLPGRLWLGASLLPLSAATLAARSVGYLSYILFLTPQFVLVAQLGATGGAPWVLALSRLLNSLGGALIGLTVSATLWPEWQRHRLHSARARAVAATRAYLAAVHGGEAGEGAGRLRRQACLAVDELQGVSSGLGLELAGGAAARAAVSVARLRRLIGAASLMEAGGTSPALRQAATRQLAAARHWLGGAQP